ncbi:hypothetical protein [Anianabacter salinae]|uniref:hypothetical protein n=1 Tax=Anianabacter salinae TaxID=2851023 RepID=UPI00225E570F|nr:hypothetical protein [Anianabacter salinae]
MTDTPPRNPLFLERRSYRRRRIADAGRLLPVAGLFLFLVPVLWRPETGGPAGTAASGVYLFAVWFGLIAGGALLSRALVRPEDPPPAIRPPEAPQEPRR